MRSRWIPWFVAAVVFGACGGDGTGDGGMDGAFDAPPDAPSDRGVEGPVGDAGGDAGEGGVPARPCDSDADCDDAWECTRASCVEGRCQVMLDHALCDDGVYCNGVERCHPRRGCVAGEPVACDDFDPCTIDRCDEEEKVCRHEPRDFDEDGEVDFRCMGGTDCDDFDPTRGARVPERCGNGVDDDCDEEVDEADCGRAPHDDCSDPLDISAGGRFVLDTAGAVPDHVVGCASGASRRDVVVRFTLSEPKDVSIAADGESLTWLVLQERCGEVASERECHLGFPAVLRARALPAGTYFVVVQDASPGGEVVLDVRFEPPTPDPANQSCAAPTDLGTGGSFEGTLVDVTDDASLACGGGEGDTVYRFTISEPKDVIVALASTSGDDSMAFELRGSCADAASTLRCTRGEPAQARYHELPPGTYFLWVESASGREVSYRLDVRFESPTPPPPGDTCADPIVLMSGEPFIGTLSDKQDDLSTRCGFAYRESVHRFTLSETRDVLLTADAGGAFLSLSVRPDCASQEGALRCESGAPATVSLRSLPPGDYYVLLESARAASYQITLETSDPVPLTEVSGNDTCERAFVVPSGGGLFRGSTMGMAQDYGASCGAMATSPDVAFQVDLPARKRLVARTDGSSFDTVLTLHRGACGSATERACDDDGGEGVSSMLDRVLDAGTWFVVVDGFGSSQAGEYLLEISVTDPP